MRTAGCLLGRARVFSSPPHESQLSSIILHRVVLVRDFFLAAVEQGLLNSTLKIVRAAGREVLLLLYRTSLPSLPLSMMNLLSSLCHHHHDAGNDDDDNGTRHVMLTWLLKHGGQRLRSPSTSFAHSNRNGRQPASRTSTLSTGKL